MTLIKRLSGSIDNIVYIPGGRQVFQGVKKDHSPQSSPGVHRQSLGNGNGEAIISSELLIEVNFGPELALSERWALVNIMPDIHRHWPRYTKRRQWAFQATKPASIFVEVHRSSDGSIYHVVASGVIDQWIDRANILLA